MDAGTDADAGSPEPTLISTHVGKDPADQFISVATINPADGHVFVGGYRGPLGSHESFSLEFDDSSPTAISQRTFPSPTGQFFLEGLVVNGKDELIISGFFSKDVNIAGKVINEPALGWGGVTARFVPTADGGDAVLSFGLTGAGDQSLWGNAALGNGTVTVGSIAQSTNFHAVPIVGDTEGDGFVSVDFQGGNEIHTTFAGPGKQQFFSVAVNKNNEIFAVGETPDVGSPLQVLGSGTKKLATVVCFDSALTLKWARALGSSLDDFFWGSATDPKTNSVVAVGATKGSINLGSGSPLPYTAGEDILVARFDVSGNLEWARTFGGGADERAYSVAITDAGDIFVAGSLNSATIDFGTGLLTKPGGEDSFLLRLDANGATRWATLIGGAGADGFNAVTFGNGKLAVAGRFQGSFELQGKTVTGTADAGTPDAGALFDVGVLVFQP